MGVLGFENMVRLQRKDGTEGNYELLDLIEHEQGYYVVLLPGADAGQKPQVFRLGLLSDGQEVYVAENDQTATQAVLDSFARRNPQIMEQLK